MLQRIEIEGKTCIKIELRVVRHTSSDGKKFFRYSALNKDGKWTDLRFRQSVGKVPTEPGIMFIQEKPLLCMSQERNRKYPRVWIHEIEKFEPSLSGKVVEYEDLQETQDLF